MQIRPLVGALILFGAITGCYADGIISFWPPPPGSPPSGAPIAVPGPFITDQYTPVLIAFPATNSIGDPVTYTATAAQGGTVEVDGAFMTYTPDPSQYFLGGSISFSALDTVSDLAFTGVVDINFIYIPGPPIIDFTISPLINSFPGASNPVIIVPSNSVPAELTFDDSGTITRDDTAPFVQWSEETNVIAGDVNNGSISESPGVYSITLWATDNLFTNSESETFEVITASTAIMDLRNFIDQLGLDRRDSAPFRRMLSKAARWEGAVRPHRAYIDLSDFKRRLQRRNDPIDPKTAMQLETAAQEIMDKL